VGVEAYPTVDALRVKVGDDEHEVPVTGDFVLAMDLDAGTVTVDLVALRDA
jgi:ribosomal 30S subunit maturation factor RimM